MSRAHGTPRQKPAASHGEPNRGKSAELIDVILGTTMRAYSSESGDLRLRARSFGGVLPEGIMERKHAFLEERIKKLEESKRKAAKSAQLTDREQRIWQVIRQGARGRLYCRELDSTRIGPRRTGVWENCPRKYESAYLGGKLWRHRIQDEKSKIQRKAKLAGLAKLASE